MKLKAAVFTSTTWDKPRNVPALGGNQTNIFVGQRIAHQFSHIEGEPPYPAEIVSMELDRQATSITIRLAYADGPKKGQPFRKMTVNENFKPWELADALTLRCDDRTMFYFDDEPAQQGQGKGK
jgi:hypothetical protein